MRRVSLGVEGLPPVIEYRSFCNTDPPGLVNVWNESFTGRGAVVLRTATLLEFFLFAKAYFDPDGLIVATDDRKLIGFTLAGSALAPTAASLIGRAASSVRLASFRRIAVRARAVAQRAEDYLRRRGPHAIRRTDGAAESVHLRALRGQSISRVSRQ